MAITRLPDEREQGFTRLRSISDRIARLDTDERTELVQFDRDSSNIEILDRYLFCTGTRDADFTWLMHPTGRVSNRLLVK